MRRVYRICKASACAGKTQKGKEEEKINTAKNMLKENYTIKQIATITQLNIESIKQIKAEFGK